MCIGNVGRVERGKVDLEEDKGCNWIDRIARGSSRIVVVLMLRERLRGRGDQEHHRGRSVRNLWYTFSDAGGDVKKRHIQALCFAKLSSIIRSNIARALINVSFIDTRSAVVYC